ncbi:Glutamate receptor [Thalictrum thalictroides]|uniref:Glutamate receptor n=1 Tax=Thalictrum thalictroides TaxID=46969 RepID=A0A7J6WM21_THATH|nr:Glutamate receptor [Thalictrum thalictroides]
MGGEEDDVDLKIGRSEDYLGKGKIEGKQNKIFLTTLWITKNTEVQHRWEEPYEKYNQMGSSVSLGGSQKVLFYLQCFALSSCLNEQRYCGIVTSAETMHNDHEFPLFVDDLISVKQVDAIISMDEKKEAGLVTELANRAQIPIFSFTAPSITPQLSSVRWPFLIRMANNDSLQMQCIASIVGSYGWHKVIVIYEDSGYNTDLGTLTLLSNELQAVGSEIEHSLAFPPFSTLNDPKTFIQEKLETLNSMNSRVFIVLPTSLELVVHISTEAMHLDFMGKDSVWIMTDSITSLLHTVNSSAMSYMEGIIGIKTYFSDTNPLLVSFLINFRYRFQLKYPEEENSEPGIYALLAYDTVSSVALTIQKSSKNSSNRIFLLKNILSRSFRGLSGEIRFEDNELSRLTTYEIVNVDHRRRCNTLKFWSLHCEFFDDVNDETCQEKHIISGGSATGVHPGPVLGGRVYWSGGLERVPLGWKMPSEAEPLVIGIPHHAAFEKFVRVGDGEPTGYCIEVFKSALAILDYKLPYKFIPFQGKYDELVYQVYLKNFSAAVGDITILEDRSKIVEFTQPYAESSLSMVVRVKPEDRTWLFVMPFTRNLWMVLMFMFVYTMFVVFPKGSPMARDFSSAFLSLSEDGTLNKLDKKWFPSYSCSNPSSDPRCSNPDNDNDDRLSPKYFMTLFLVTGLTSTAMLVLYIVDLFRKFRRISDPLQGTTSVMDDSVWNGMKRLMIYFNEGRLNPSHKGSVSSPAGNVEMITSSDGDYWSDNTPRHGQSTPLTDIEMPNTYTQLSNTQTRFLGFANSFPTWGTRVHGLSH